MEEYLYIIAGIAYLAYSFYGASKKKKEKQPRNENQPYEKESVKETDFDLEKLFGIDSIKREIEELPYEIMGVQKEETFEYEPAYEDVKQPIVEEAKAAQMKYSENVVQQIQIEEEEEEIIEEKEQLDLRAAIIYSEILNPPYIQK